MKANSQKQRCLALRYDLQVNFRETRCSVLNETVPYFHQILSVPTFSQMFRFL